MKLFISYRSLDSAKVDEIKGSYDDIWKEVRSSRLAFGFQESQIPTMSVSETERKAIFQRAWDAGGGFRFMFETFNDIDATIDSSFSHTHTHICKSDEKQEPTPRLCMHA